MSRPKRWWYTYRGRYRIVWATHKAMTAPMPTGWTLCFCHGRMYVEQSWKGQLKRRRR